jgi:hypothetical protein
VTHGGSNGREPEIEAEGRASNPYLDALRGSKPPEIVEFEMNTDPYANMLPGISSIRAARTLGRSAADRRSRGRSLSTIFALFALAIIAVALVAAVVAVVPH